VIIVTYRSGRQIRMSFYQSVKR